MTPTPPPQAFVDWWAQHPHSGAITPQEAWLCKSYRDQWCASRRDSNQATSEHWWQR
jgi:hypothetical protein